MVPRTSESQPVTTRAKPIQHVRSGERVWACDVASGEWSARQIIQPLVHEYDGDIVSVTAGDQTIEATGNHPFWVTAGEDLHQRPPAKDVAEQERATSNVSARGRWVESRDLRIGDLLMRRSGETARADESAR